MIPSILSATGLLTVVVLFFAYRRRRSRVYHDLARSRAALVDSPQSEFPASDLALLRETFAAERIAQLDDVLPSQSLAALRTEAWNSRDALERSYIPFHKQGGTLAYETIHRRTPRSLGLFHSPQFNALVSSIVGETVHPTADHDQSACSVLYYTEAGDHIGWHYDHNFYRGRHYTVLVALANEAPGGGLSHSRLEYKDVRGHKCEVAMAPNTLVVFEGARIRHRVTPLGNGELRIMLSMTYSTDPRISKTREVLRRVKDTAFIGIRALWD